jgi:hypothetical protein
MIVGMIASKIDGIGLQCRRDMTLAASRVGVVGSVVAAALTV